MSELHARIASAIARVRSMTINNGEPTDFDRSRADAVLAEIGTTHILMDRDEAMHLYDVLMAANKTMAARKLFDLLEEQKP